MSRQITIRNVDDEIVDSLKRQAENNGRSFEAELREILRHAAKPSLNEMRIQLQKMQEEHFGDKVLSESWELIREDRDR